MEMRGTDTAESSNERVAELDLASQWNESLPTQGSWIRETRIVNIDTTLGARLQTLFQERGIAIGSLLAALGILISTITLSATNSVGSVAAGGGGGRGDGGG